MESTDFAEKRCWFGLPIRPGHGRDVCMPRRLLARCQPDSIQEFRAAARQRFDDALYLATEGRRTGAIYLWGYTAEMTLKAAYFSSQGRAEADALTWRADIQPAILRGRAMGIAWPDQGAGHNVRAWAEFLSSERGRCCPIPPSPRPLAWRCNDVGSRSGSCGERSFATTRITPIRTRSDRSAKPLPGF